MYIWHIVHIRHFTKDKIYGGGLAFAAAKSTNYYLPRYSDKTKYYAVYAKNKRNITIDGDGAKIWLKGDVSGF